MFSKSSFVLALAVLNVTAPVLAAPPQFFQPRAGGVCNSGIYGELAPVLAQYPAAQAFCSAVYPVKCTTKVAKRAGTTTTTTTGATTKARTTTTTTKKATSTTSTDAKASAWSKCQGQGSGVVSTMCSCIEVPKVRDIR